MIKTNKELALACENVAKNYKSLYVLGAFGWPMTSANKQRAIASYSYNRQASRTAKINASTVDTFGFDCVCLIKALLWGWNGDTSKSYGGAVYESNGVPDINESAMLNSCNDISTDFTNIMVGEVVWIPGHIGVYVGNGLAVECTPIWKDGVQYTAVHNIGKKSGYNGRTWTKHGKLPYITYEAEKPVVDTTISVGDIVEIAPGAVYYDGSAIPSWVMAKHWIVKSVSGDRAVIDKSTDGKSAICSPINTKYLSVVDSTKPTKKSVEELAREVINGDWGNGAERKNRLAAAGYDYNAVQKMVNELLS